MQYDLGYFDDETCRLELIQILRPEMVTHVVGMIYVSGMDGHEMARRSGGRAALLPLPAGRWAADSRAQARLARTSA